MLIDDWTWPAIALAFIIGGIASRWWLQNRSTTSHQVSQEYFKGLNFLLNEQPDKAIEVFIKALEVDSETVELHLALGGLFRRKGQVDRATRIHQNLIARPSLTDEQRLQAIYELAQDYYKAGLLDRAENLFLELKDSQSYREASLEGLCSIYQQEKEWAKAIEVSRMHKRSLRNEYSQRIAHYWCELAEQSIGVKKFDDARKYLRSALNEDRAAARAVLLQGELGFQQKKYQKALSLWLSLSVNNPSLAAIVVEKIILCYRRLNDTAELKEYLLHVASIPKDEQAFNLWRESMIEEFGDKATAEQLLEQARNEGLSGPVADYLYRTSASDTFSPRQKSLLLEDMLGRAKSRKIEYTCSGCGFDTKAMHWFCVNCGEWDSFS